METSSGVIHSGLGLCAERASLRRGGGGGGGEGSSQVLKVCSRAFSEILVDIRDTIYCDAVGSWVGAAAVMNSLKKFSRVKIGVETIEEYIVKALFLETEA